MAFRNWYLGWDNNGFEFGSKKELIDHMESTPEILAYIRKWGYVSSVIKENDSSRTWFFAELNDEGRIILVKDYHERAYDGAYGS